MCNEQIDEAVRIWHLAVTSSVLYTCEKIALWRYW